MHPSTKFTAASTPNYESLDKITRAVGSPPRKEPNKAKETKDCTQEAPRRAAFHTVIYRWPGLLLIFVGQNAGSVFFWCKTYKNLRRELGHL